MPTPDPILQRYLSEAYLEKNPHWDSADSPWKARHICTLLSKNRIVPSTIADVGCGSGNVLAEMRKHFACATLHGFDVAPAAAEFWREHEEAGITFQLGDFFQHNKQRYDVILVLDVLEHMADPFSFLSRLGSHAERFVFHIPLDLSTLSVAREKPLLYVRDKVGHIHYYTKGLALALLEDCGYRIVDYAYTNASMTAPQLSLISRVAGVMRRAARALVGDAAVRVLGGETLMVLAAPVDRD